MANVMCLYLSLHIDVHRNGVVIIPLESLEIPLKQDVCSWVIHTAVNVDGLEGLGMVDEHLISLNSCSMLAQCCS